MRVLTIVGNPATPSRTRVTADRLSEVLAEMGGEVTTVDLAMVAVDGLAHGRLEAEAQEALDAMKAADLLLVVTPIFKGSYTGLLKLLFDVLPHEALARKVAIPVMLGAWPGHFLALDHALKPLFSALGATSTKGLLVMETTANKEAQTLDPDVIEKFRPIAQEAVLLVDAFSAAPSPSTPSS